MSKRHSPEQIIRKLRQAEARLSLPGQRSRRKPGSSVAISEGTFHRWKNLYGGMSSSEAKRLKELEKENSSLEGAGC